MAQRHHPTAWLGGGSRLPADSQSCQQGGDPVPSAAGLENPEFFAGTGCKSLPLFQSTVGVRDLPQAGGSMVTNSGRGSKQDGAGRNSRVGGGDWGVGGGEPETPGHLVTQKPGSQKP